MTLSRPDSAEVQLFHRLLREQWIRARYDRNEFVCVERQEPYSAGKTGKHSHTQAHTHTHTHAGTQQTDTRKHTHVRHIFPLSFATIFILCR